MKVFLLKRLFYTVLMLIGISIITFTLSHVVPGDPVLTMLGGRGTDEQIEKMREDLGLNKPIHEQYFIYMKGLINFDLGESIRTKRDVTADLKNFFPATFELSTFAIILSIILGIPLGILSAVKKDSWLDQGARIFSLLGVSMPVFWLGLLLMALFYNHLHFLPSSGRIAMFIMPPRDITGLYLVDSLITGNFDAFWSSLQHIILPAFCLGYLSTAQIARMMRSSMLEVMNQDYIRSSYSFGLSEKLIIFKLAFKNAFIPTLTIIGLSYGSLLSGAVLTETIFSWPGIGRYVVESMLFLDFPAVMGVTLLIALVYSLANLFVDLLYGFFDPRIKYDEIN
ncbi:MULTISPECIES: ABC transporter permease [unclassified Halanaerobium]|uniref:ABC transporter permease n=1 Tax=unclassified Halanaerobium TaxID=2641197 RepID=UPI000E19320A|nr:MULTISPECIES: ABC transporter permease [unclassified Halanaerobium]RCW48655.1 peptide/nickel transport system permease protein [Halanaerobium sp. MA284_MarDTE_T2]RCW86602.1 peptide/nickel transport system permease protein [Halanaerobium sp. DL-01]